MRRFVILLNSVTAVFFVCFFLYTFMAKEHLEGLARDFVTEKTLQYSGPVMAVADEVMQQKLVQKFLGEDKTAAIRGEIDAYNADPAEYVANLTGKTRQLAAKKAPPGNPMLAKASEFKDRIREYYDDTLAALIRDLRIFAGTNLVVATLALGLAVRSGEKIHQPIVWFSFLMFAAVLYSSYLYVDGMTFFNILSQTHLGWWYPLLLGVTLVGLYLQFGRAPRTVADSVHEESPTASSEREAGSLADPAAQYPPPRGE